MHSYETARTVSISWDEPKGMNMNKQEARDKFDMITGWLAYTALEGGQGSVDELARKLLLEADIDGFMMLLKIINVADYELSELNLPEDNEPLKVVTGAEGFLELATYLYGFGARRYLRLDIDQQMGGDMWGSLEELLQSLRDRDPALPSG